MTTRGIPKTSAEGIGVSKLYYKTFVKPKMYKDEYNSYSCRYQPTKETHYQYIQISLRVFSSLLPLQSRYKAHFNLMFIVFKSTRLFTINSVKFNSGRHAVMWSITYSLFTSVTDSINRHKPIICTVFICIILHRHIIQTYIFT